MGRTISLDCRYFQWHASFIGIYYLMLSTMISKHPLDIRHQSHYLKVSDENSHPDKTINQIEYQGRTDIEQPGEEKRDNKKQDDRQGQGTRYHHPNQSPRKLLLFNGGLIVAGVPFPAVAAYAWVFWIVGGLLSAIGLGWFLKDRWQKKPR